MQNFSVRRAIKALNTFFVPSEFTKKELVEVYGVDAQKIAVTPLGYCSTSTTTASEVEHGVFKKYNIKKPYFLFIGRKDAKKNIAGILQAFKIFSEKNTGYFLVLAGPPGIIHNTCYIIQKVILLDWIDFNDKQILLSGAEALLFPSLYEGFGMPILEAFAAGTPVITSNAASMPEVAGDVALLVDPKNPQEIARAMEKIVKNPALKAEFAQKGMERLKAFSWAKCAEKTLHFMALDTFGKR